MTGLAHKLQVKYAKADDSALEGALRQLLGTYEGRKLIWWLLETTGVYRTPFRTNALAMSFEAGQQNVGLRFQALLMEKFPEEYLKLMEDLSNERAQRERNIADANRADARSGGDPD